MSHNQSLGSSYYVEHVTIISVFTVLASVAVVLRFWARKIQKMSLELNDFLIVLALLFALGTTALDIYGCCAGLGKEQSEAEIIFELKSQFMGPLIWVTSVTFIRASLVLLYIRLFPTRLFRKVCYLVHIINIMFFFSTVLADCLICQPISYRWNRITGGSGSCGHQKSLDLYIGIFNLLLDVTVVVLPMPVLWGLKMAVGKRLMLTGMFGMGTTICALTLYRIYHTTTIRTSDAQEGYALLALLTNLEAQLGVINACLPVLKPIFNKLRSILPKRGNGSAVSETLKSGTIIVFMRVSQMFTLNSRKSRYASSDEVILSEDPTWSGEKTNGQAAAEEGKRTGVTAMEISPPLTSKAEGVLGLKGQEIHVRRDVEVESVASRDERDLVYEKWEGRQERW